MASTSKLSGNYNIKLRETLENSLLTDMCALRDTFSGFDYNVPKFSLTFFLEPTGEKRNLFGETELHVACRKGFVHLAEHLLTKILDINVKDHAGWTPLHEAVIANHENIVEMLLQNGADVNVVGRKYITPLHAALYPNVQPRILQLLVQYGASLTARDVSGQIPLHIVNKMRKVEFRHLILSTPKAANIQNRYSLPQPVIFCYTSETAEELRPYPGVTVHTNVDTLMNGNITYFIVEPEHIIMKHIQAAMLQGAFITSLQAMKEFLNSPVIIPDPFQYIYTVEGYNIYKAMVNRIKKRPKLFDGVSFRFCDRITFKHDNEIYTRNELIRLAALGGGTIFLRTISETAENKYITYHGVGVCSKIHYYHICNCKRHTIRSKKIFHRTTNWFLDCINNFALS